MSILIKSMKMPDNCGACPLETDYGTCGYYSLFVEAGHDSEIWKRRDDCPLIEIPPHGRLIDADAFTKDECNYCDGACEALPCDCLNCKSDCRCDFMKDIANAPTIIEPEPFNDLAKPNDTIFAVQNTDEDEWLFAAKPIDYMHHPSVEEIIEGNGFDSFIKHFED